MLITLQEDFTYCGNLIYNEVTIQVTDVTESAYLVLLDLTLQEELGYVNTVKYTSVSPTITDITSSITTITGKELCSLVGSASTNSLIISSTNECGCS